MDSLCVGVQTACKCLRLSVAEAAAAKAPRISKEGRMTFHSERSEAVVLEDADDEEEKS